jgi:hypothetical protein
VLLVAFLLLGALGTPWPWAALWVVLPAAAATTMLAAWRFGRAVLVVPLVLLAGALGWFLLGGASAPPPWFTLWVPAAALTGAWMGLREEGGGPSLGERAFMFAPLLLLAAALPIAPGFVAAVGKLDGAMHVEQERMMASFKPGELPAPLLDAMQQSAKLPAEDRQKTLTLMVPNLLFVWTVLLVCAGRVLASRIATLIRWPSVSRSPLARWRLPDAALVPLIAAIAMLAFADRAWHPSALTLLVHVVLGYSVQGVAVVESVLLARGMSPAFVALTMLFVLAVSLLWVLPAIAVVGLSDVWLDYRRLEPSPEEA